MGTANPARGIRERFHPLIWRALWPARAWFVSFPIRRGKGALYRYVLRPLLPPEPAGFNYQLGDGSAIPLTYREDLGFKIRLFGQYEERELVHFCRYIRPGTTVFDVGGNIGVPALRFARAVGEQGKVISFEPGQATAARYRKHLAINGFANAEVQECAVGSSVGTITFHQSSSSMLSSATVVPPGFVRSVEVPMVSLDHAWETAGSPEVSALKIDCEGGELAVLQGAAALLAAQQPAVLLEAWSEEELKPITDILERHGYRRLQPEGYEGRNYLFLPASLEV